MDVQNLSRGSDTIARDVILLDQRGNGFSIPNLKCSERDEALRTALKENASSSQIQNEIINATLSCRDRLIAAKVELEAYNLKENVADFEDLRKALDIFPLKDD